MPAIAADRPVGLSKRRLDPNNGDRKRLAPPPHSFRLSPNDMPTRPDKASQWNKRTLFRNGCHDTRKARFSPSSTAFLWQVQSSKVPCFLLFSAGKCDSRAILFSLCNSAIDARGQGHDRKSLRAGGVIGSEHEKRRIMHRGAQQLTGRRVSDRVVLEGSLSGGQVALNG